MAPRASHDPYPPSWVDRLTDWVEGLPGPAALYYLLAAAVLTLAVAGNQWISGVPFPTVRPFYIFFGALVPYIIGLIHLLDQRAAAALDRFRPLLAADEAELTQMHRRLTTLPAGPTLLATLLGLLAGLGFAVGVPLEERVQLTELAVSTASQAVNSPLLVIAWIFYAVLFYHTLHQLREIGHILDHHTRVSLFEVSPIFGFSGVTALTAVGITVVSLGWAVTLPNTVNSFVGLLPHMIFAAAAVAAFLWPLLGVHRLLAVEKDAQLGRNARMIEAASAELHARVARGEFTGMETLNNALASLEIERRLVEAAPTWPWSPQTPRAVAAGLLLPLLIWAIQRAVEAIW
jgi:hypothetical protein